MKPLKLEEISTLIKEQIKKYEKVIDTKSVGTVIKVILRNCFSSWFR